MAASPMGGGRLRKIGWAAVLLTCTTLYLGLHLRVNAVRSEVARPSAALSRCRNRR